MLNLKLHLLNRMLVVVCVVGFAAQAHPVQAENEAGAVQPAHAEVDSSKASIFGNIMQIGGKKSGKSATGGNDTKGLPDLEAKGSSDSASRKGAIAAMPLDQLPVEHRQKISSLLKSTSYYRRLPSVTFIVDPDAYHYFVNHPDVAVSIWRAMNISKLQMWQTAKTEFEADTGDGSVGALEILHSDKEKCLVTCDGQYKSPLFSKPISAKSVLLLQTSFAKQADGTFQVTHRADLFVVFPSQTIDVVARIFSPLTVKMTDRTFTEVSLFLKMMSAAMARRPDWVEQISEKMDGVPDLRKEQLNSLSQKMFAATLAREGDGWADVEEEDLNTANGESGTGKQKRADASGDRKKTASEGTNSIRVTSSAEKSAK